VVFKNSVGEVRKRLKSRSLAAHCCVIGNRMRRYALRRIKKQQLEQSGGNHAWKGAERRKLHTGKKGKQCYHNAIRML
jgi:hypothetical protein